MPSQPSEFIIDSSRDIVSTISEITILGKSETHFVAKALRFGHWIVVKGLNPPYRNDEALLAMLRKEFKIQIEIQHPNIVKALDFVDLEELGPCIVMEYTEGPTLGDWLKTHRDIPSRLEIACELASAVGYLHEKGIVHRDIKPENIIVSRLVSHARLIDFGLSDSDRFEVFKQPGGTPGYVSPEQAIGGDPDPRNDVYSFGKVLEILLPEKRFRNVVALCLAPIGERPSDIKLVSRQLRRARSSLMPFLFIGISLILIVACSAIWFFRASRSSELTEFPPSLGENTQTTPSETQATPGTIEPLTEVNDFEKPSALNPQSVSSLNDPINEDHTAILRRFEKEGINVIDYGWMQIRDALAQTDVITLSDLMSIKKSLYNFKDSYIEALDLNIKMNPERFHTDTDLTDKEKEELDYRLKQHIDNIYDTWKDSINVKEE